MKTPSLLALFALLTLSVGAADAPPGNSATPRPYPDRLRWWANARFGVFIHWGPVSLKGTEISWSRANTNPKCPNRGEIPADIYDGLYRDFNPLQFKAEEGVDTIRAAGAGYLVLTAKHCDGFLLWNSEQSDYNIMRSPFKRDVCAELARSAHAARMRIGWYFSPMDWRDPDFRTERNPLFLGRMQGELRELLSHYGPVDLVWFDWDGREPVYDQAKTYSLVQALQPQAIVNNRLDLGSTNSDRQVLSSHADYYTPEQSVGAYDDQCPWESCMTTSRKNQWAWGGASDGVKPLAECLGMLIRCAGGDGNVLLNVGPRPDGKIDPDQASLLREMGTWLAQYGESIYGTRGGPFKPGEFGVSTRKNNTVFLHILDWTDSTLKLPVLPAVVTQAQVLGGGPAKVRQSEAGLEVSVAPADRHAIDTVVVLELDRPALGLSAIDVPAPAFLNRRAKATASNVYQRQSSYGPDQAVDGNLETRWATDADVTSAWLEVDLGAPTRFSRAFIRQAFPELERIRRFQIEYWADGEWKACYRGEKLGATLSASFPKVTARRVRLNITEGKGGPTVCEFRLLR